MMVPNFKSVSVSVILIFFLALLPGYSEQSSFEDTRCRCVCPPINGTLPVHIKLIDANDCTCEKVVKASKEICHFCDCKYENRNTTTIKVVVIFIICVVTLLFIYMVFLLCLDPFIQHRPAHYTRHHDEQDMSTIPRPAQAEEDSETSAARQRSLLNRMTEEQKKWKGTVQEQRRNIYDRHNMLN